MATKSLEPKYIDTFLECRLFRHAWELYAPISYNSMFTDVLHLRCVRCGTTRHDALDVNGKLTNRRYIYVEGYQFSRGFTRPTTMEMRLMMMKRQTTFKRRQAKARGQGKIKAPAS